MKPPGRSLLISLPLLFIISTLFAQEKYRAVHWGADEGLSVEEQNIILKDVNGFIWMGSLNGLNRFDGRNFKQYFPDKNNPGSIIGSFSNSLIEDSLHNIWIGTEKGLSRFDIKAETFRNFLTDASSVNTDIVPFWATRDDVYCVEMAAYITSYNVHSYTKKILVKLNPAEGGTQPSRFVHSVFDAVSNSVWMLEGSDELPGGGLVQVSIADGKETHYTWPCYKNIQGHNHNPKDLCYDRKRNAIWISSPDGLNEFTLADKQFHRTEALHDIINLEDFSLPAGVNVDVQGRIWWCSWPTGIIIYDPATRSFTPLFTTARKQQSVVYANLYIYCDRNGMAWTTCSEQANGVFQIIPASLPVLRYKADKNLPHSLSGRQLNFITNADHGKLWIGQDEELNIFDPQSGFFQQIRNEQGLPFFKETFIYPMLVDSIHQIALFETFTQSGYALFQMDILHKKFHPVIFIDSAGQKIPVTPTRWVPLALFKSGGMLFCNQGMFIVNTDSALARWVGPPEKNLGGLFGTDNDHLLFMRRLSAANNLTYTLRNGKWTRISSPVDSLEWGTVYYNKPDHTFWVGCFSELTHFDKELRVIHRYTVDDGLIRDAITGILPDDQGNIWIQYLRAVARLNLKTGKITGLSENDGYVKQAYGLNPPVRSGRDLYFWGNEGIDRVSPDKLIENYPPSFAYFKSLSINQQPFSLPTGINDLQKLSLRYFQNKITIETGIIDYYTKGSSSIRYKLENVNENWQLAPANYTIRYDGLSPGKYWLVLQASNAANDFNGPEKRLLIDIHPPFWQTWWFRIVMGIVLIILLYGIYRWRTATLHKQKRILEQTVKERTAEVVEEKAEVEKQKAKSDELLLNILPLEVAEELKEKGYTTARSFDEVTILFSDIKGFTHVAERMTAQGLVKEIDTYFSSFDRIMQQFGLEKIKTIGDAYIAAGGLPEENKATVENVIEAAIAMQNAVENLKKERIENGLPYFEIRIGIHTGPVVAGVVGIKKFQYDIWGDTVNMAARMEQSGMPGKINISQFTYDKVKAQFTCTSRGKIEAKNKGDVDMYFVEF